MMLGSVSKAGRLLSLFTLDSPEWGVSEVAKELGIAKSSAFALLVTLDDIGLVRRLSDSRYRLGWRIAELNRTLRQSTDFINPARQQLQQFANQLQATVHIAGLHSSEVVYLDRICGRPGPTLTESGVGTVMPAHSTALGKVLLASRGPAEVDSMLALHGLRPCTTRTITAADALRTELARVRLVGYGRDVEETVPSVCCVAAPIRDRSGSVDAAVSFTVLATQFSAHELQLRTIVRSFARDISRRRRLESQLAHVG